MKDSKIKVFYRPEICPSSLASSDQSRSPLKPRLLMEFIEKEGLSAHFELINTFAPFNNDDFYCAHTREYVDGFFKGEAPYSSGKGFLGIEWNPDFAQSTRYTNASLYNAILESIQHPDKICLSPTSGFHHAVPEHGALFCAFSGQVIAATKIYNALGLSGLFIDLDSHFGNSIEDSRYFVKDLNKAIPQGCNINIRSKHQQYLEDLKLNLLTAEDLFLENKIHYVVFCHGADSHEEVDLGNQLNTEEWIECADIVANWVLKMEEQTGKQIPLSLCLFGGYRDDDFNSVLSLHTASLMKTLNVLSGNSHVYEAKVTKKVIKL